MTAIRVLLSTYNGEKYLEEQLQSLINQNSVEVDILVRDDGSSDGTTEILERWQEKGLLKWYSGGNKGFAFSFMDLIENSGSYDYYAFCDQDDIWLPDKLMAAKAKLDSIDNPIKLYCSNLYYYKNGENLGLVKNAINKYDICTSMIQNIAVGCTVVFNRGLKEIMTSRMPKHMMAHDYWAFQVAMLLGEVIYDPNAYILYRQHSNNQIGAKTTFREIWKRRFNNFLSSQKITYAHQAQELLSCFSSEISLEKYESVHNVAAYRSSIWKRLKLFGDKRYVMSSTSNNIMLRIKILLGKI